MLFALKKTNLPIGLCNSQHILPAKSLSQAVDDCKNITPRARLKNERDTQHIHYAAMALILGRGR